MFKLGSPVSARQSEQLIDQIISAEESGDLRVPTRLPDREFGGIAAFLQACATWSRRFPNAYIRTYARVDTVEHDLHKLISSDHGAVAALLADGVHDNAGGDISWIARRQVLERLAAMPSEHDRGRKIMIVSADDTAMDSPPAIYATKGAGGGTIHTEAGFRLLAHRMINAGSRVGDARTLRSKEPQIAQLLLELVRNAHEYGRFEADDLTRVQRSVRFVRAEGIFDERSHVLDHLDGDSALHRFASATSVGTRARFLEITVWDSGPGLAARRLREQGINSPTFDEEWRASSECFEKHLTTSDNGARGLGLDHVQSMMTELHGFLRMRTGRVLLERDYHAHPHSDGMASTFGEPIARSAAVGTAITLVIPTDFGRS